MSSSFNGTSPQGLFRVPNAMEIHTTPRTNSQSASVVSVNGLCGRIATLLIRMSTRPMLHPSATARE
jgi:hypothetical protein